MCLKYRESGTRAQLQQLSLHSSPHPEAFSSILCLFSLFLLHATIHPSFFSPTTTFFFFFCYLLLLFYYLHFPLLISYWFLLLPSFLFFSFRLLYFHSFLIFLHPFLVSLLPPSFTLFLFYFSFISLSAVTITPLCLYFLHESLALNAETVFHPKCDLTVVWWNTDITGWHDRDIIPNLGIWHNCC